MTGHQGRTHRIGVIMSFSTFAAQRVSPISLYNLLHALFLLVFISSLGCKTLSGTIVENIYCDDVEELSTPPGVARRLIGAWHKRDSDELLDYKSTEFVKINAGAFTICAQDSDDRFWCWGSLAGPEYMGTPGVRYQAFATGVGTLCAIDDSHHLRCWYFREGIRRAHYERRTLLDIGYGMFVWTGLTTDGKTVGLFLNSHRPEYQITNSHNSVIDFEAGSHFSCWINSNDQSIECDNELLDDATPEGEFRQLSCTDTYCCAVSQNDNIECFGPTELPDPEYLFDTPDGRFASVSAGLWHACALDKRGFITCWGENESGQTDAPGGKYTQISAGGAYTCALNTKNELHCWGHQYSFCMNRDSPRAD